jgi:hypothetical protein
LEDPRVDRTKLHKLVDILVIAICAVIAGADNWEDIEEFGKARQEWFQTFLELPNGIPSHVDPAQFQRCFINWNTAVSQLVGGLVLHRSHDKGPHSAPLNYVSANYFSHQKVKNGL